MEENFHVHRLDNGLRIVIEVMPHVRSAAAGFLARTGARDETRAIAGVSHYLEHMCFKGTPNRTWEQINIDFDEMGAAYNAFTSKQRTFYFGWVRAGDIENQMELLADMMRPALPPAEFDMEKNVILEEIAMANDTAYGLAAYVYTTNLSRGLRAAERIDAGSVCVNEVHYAVQLPHGGVKQSGVGRDCSRYSIEEYLTLKRVSVLV